tara:strand:- start:92526 stop:93311 length:786 start_codon:yes stop_codon:yes gene_type:complete
VDSVNYIINFLKHKLKAKNQHGIHSPFVFDLYNNVLANRIPFYIFDDIESIRAKLLLSPQNITITDLGAGSKKMASNRRKIADITKYTSKKPKIAQLLFRLVNYLKPQTILELGTSVGISSMYMAASNSRAKVITVEGDPKIAQIAQINFDKLKFKNIRLINKSFEAFFEHDFDKIDRLDFVFIDGNHQYASTINYFNKIKPKLHEKSIVIIDDIYWSKEMTKAWKELCALLEVTVSIDIFEMGFLFFKPGQVKEHFFLKI